MQVRSRGLDSANVNLIFATAGAYVDTIGAASDLVYGRNNVTNKSAISTAVGGLRNVYNASVSAYNALTDYESAYDAYSTNARNAVLDINTQQPEVTFPTSLSTQLFTGNTFLVYDTFLSVNDAYRFDAFLSAYGYACNEEATAEAFTCRQNFNYVSFEDVSIGIITGASLAMRERAKQQLQNGVRIWHKVFNSAEIYSYNPIVN